ncbi:MAG: hypothetical protein NTX50_31855 [Candidatus Sumerlaeota bacterium]|nr:hypothetical protein [Candidatus Sumerlaeota bacterium]
MATTSCLAISGNIVGTTTIRLRDISTSSVTALLVTWCAEKLVYTSVYLEKESHANISGLPGAGSAHTLWRLRGAAVSRWELCDWTGADLQLPSARRDEIRELIKRETSASLRAENLSLPLPYAGNREGLVNAESSEKRLFETIDPLRAEKWVALDMRPSFQPPVYFSLSFISISSMDLANAVAGSPLRYLFRSYPPQIASFVPSLALLNFLKMLGIMSLAGLVWMCLVAPFAHAATIQARVRERQFDQIRVTCLSDEEIYEGSFAGAWRRLRQPMLLIVPCLFAATALMIAMSGIHAYVSWLKFLEDAHARRWAVQAAILACACVAAPFTGAISLCACAACRKSWIGNAFTVIAIPVIFASIGAIAGPVILLTSHAFGIAGRLSIDSYDAWRDWSWAAGAGITLALIIWLFFRTLRWTRRSFVRRVMAK